jgi:hypothetical protein
MTLSECRQRSSDGAAALRPAPSRRLLGLSECDHEWRALAFAACYELAAGDGVAAGSAGDRLALAAVGCGEVLGEAAG